MTSEVFLSSTQTSNATSTGYQDVYYLHVLELVKWSRSYLNIPENYTCPALNDDLFHQLHNYTDHRPSNAEEFQHVMASCEARIWSCFERWNWEYMLAESSLYCYCHFYGWCKEFVVFNVTNDHRQYLDHMMSVAHLYLNSQKVDEVISSFLKDLEWNTTLVVLYGIVCIWGLTGNLLVIISVFCFIKHESVTNLFIVNLSVGDIVVIGFALPFRYIIMVLKLWMWDDWLCKCIWLVYYTSLMVSSFTMTAMAMERYLVICYPMKAQYISTPGRAKKIIATVWVAAISLSSVAASFFDGKVAVNDCTLVHARSSPLFAPNDIVTSSMVIVYYILAVAFLIPLMIIIFAYTNVGMSLHKSLKEVRAIARNFNLDKLNPKRDDLASRIQVVKMLVVVLVTFVVTWLPTLLMDFLNYSHAVMQYWFNIFGTKVSYRDIQSVITLLTFINSCLNPIYYGLYSKSFREGFVKCFSCCQKKKSKMPSSINMITSADSGFRSTTFNTSSALQYRSS